jgi:hypothetical protein
MTRESLPREIARLKSGKRSIQRHCPLQDIFGNVGGTSLNFITCAGDWIPSQHQTNLRLVVYTTFV